MTHNHMTSTTAILAAGDFPTHPAPLAALAGAEHVVCCDSAARRLLDYGREPDAVVGDMDSLSPELRQHLGKRIHQVDEQDDNDLAKAFRFALSQGWRDIVILGATGKREDHTLGNIAWLAIDLDNRLYSRASLDLVQLALAVWGMYEWRRKITS